MTTSDGDAIRTEGPWRYQEGADAYTHIVRAGDRFICQLAQDTSGEAEANARLIANAPSLLKAVRSLFAGGFIDAGTREHSEWSQELARRLVPLRIAASAANTREVMSEMTKEQVGDLSHQEIVHQLRKAARYEREHIGITWEHGNDLINILAIHGDWIADALEAAPSPPIRTAGKPTPPTEGGGR